jgi:FtsP/CotA-like multicopper oxidase with cupredoxin domain
MNTIPWTLSRDAAGQLVYTGPDGQPHENIMAVRAFPIAAPGEDVSLLGKDGHELAWIPSLQDLPEDRRDLIASELAVREFMPNILSIKRVGSFATPSTWLVETDRGITELTLKAEDHIRRLSPDTLLITDSQGIAFLINDIGSLDSHSRKLLDRFL